MGPLPPAPSILDSASGPASAWSPRARWVHDRVCKLDGIARRQALDLECGDDWTLHAEVAAHLAHDAHPSLPRGRVAAGSVGAPSDVTDHLALDSIVGYRIGRLIGIGGSGAVYEAEPRRVRNQARKSRRG